MKTQRRYDLANRNLRIDRKMTVFLALLLFIFVRVNGQAQERIQTEKLDPSTTKKKIHEAVSNYQSLKKLGEEITYLRKKFRNNAELHIFYTPSLTGNLHTFVVNQNGALIREREIILSLEFLGAQSILRSSIFRTAKVKA